MSDAIVHFGGVPVAPDVQKLIDTLGLPAPGQDIKHEDIEAALGIERTEKRYRTVTAAWRKRLADEQSLHVDSLFGIGFRCLLPEERITNSQVQMKRGVRRVARGVKTAALVPPDDLDTLGRMRRTHLITHGGALVQQATDMQRTMPKLPAPKSRPQQGEL